MLEITKHELNYATVFFGNMKYFGPLAGWRFESVSQTNVTLYFTDGRILRTAMSNVLM